MTDTNRLDMAAELAALDEHIASQEGGFVQGFYTTTEIEEISR